MTSVCMIYGATGRAGSLILDAALARGLRPVIAGRHEEAVRALAERHQLSFRAFSLDNAAAVTAALEDVDVVLNAAGPLRQPEALAHWCIEQGLHYLDIGCDPGGLRRLAALDEAARDKGVAIIAGAGFSPAVAEALALHLLRRLPHTVRLIIALSTGARPSPGLIRAALEIAMRPSRALRRGRLRTMRRRRMGRFDFGRGPERCYGLGWGELEALHRSTGVRNIDFFVRTRPDLLRLLRMPALLAALRRLPGIRGRLDAWAEAHGAHTPYAGRKPVRSRLVGHAYDAQGQRAASRLHLPDPYTVTAGLAAAALARAVSAAPAPGVLTTAQFLGPDFLAEIPGLHVDWEELELTAPGELRLRIRPRGRRRRKDGTAPQPADSAAITSAGTAEIQAAATPAEEARAAKCDANPAEAPGLRATGAA